MTRAITDGDEHPLPAPCQEIASRVRWDLDLYTM